MLVVDKPSGVLTVAGKDKSIPCLAKAAFDNVDVSDDLPTADHMVVHRLGMDTSGLIMMAKNRDALRTLNGVFRERKVERRYEALVAGHMERDLGLISLPVMRDYQCPPYVRISTFEHQMALVDLDPDVVGKKILEMPKDSITKYEVMSREYLEGHPVTRVTLTSISGRYHQLNVHLAAVGHPIVGDAVYGIAGEAVPNGGLNKEEMKFLVPNRNRASAKLQRDLADVVAKKKLMPCIHAKFIRFTHPYTKKIHEFTTESPF
jgi:tRNA pseudouridine32 synthase / 23S rRNA pseudouridine746 synthase